MSIHRPILEFSGRHVRVCVVPGHILSIMYSSNQPATPSFLSDVEDLHSSSSSKVSNFHVDLMSQVGPPFIQWMPSSAQTALIPPQAFLGFNQVSYDLTEQCYVTQVF